MQQLTLQFKDVWYENPKDLKLLFPEGAYIHLYEMNIEDMVIDGLYKIIKHHKNSIEVLYHYRYDKARWSFRSVIVKHKDVVKFKEWEDSH